MQRHRDSTCQTYYIVWRKFNEFFIKLDSKPNTWEDRLVLFTAYLVDKGFRSTTIKSYISTVKSILTEVKVKLNVDQSPITSLTKACRLQNDQMATRLPIQKGLLQLIINQIESHYWNRGQCFLSILYKALFLTAYYGLSHVGELTVEPHAILARNVHVAKNKNKLLFILESSKTHTKSDKPQLVKISSIPVKDQIHNNSNKKMKYSCPFEALK